MAARDARDDIFAPAHTSAALICEESVSLIGTHLLRWVRVFKNGGKGCEREEEKWARHLMIFLLLLRHQLL
jgi:hypothetical protein